MKLMATPEFREWRAGLDEYRRGLLGDRLQRVKRFSHFGDSHDLGGSLAEMRWASGMRVYYAVVTYPDGTAALLLLGGDKNGQERDIAKARKLLRREQPQASAAGDRV